MKKIDNPATSEQMRNAIGKLKGIKFQGPEELAKFLIKENAQFTARDLIAFSYILATRFGRHQGMSHVPELLAEIFSDFVKGVSCRTVCDPWAGVGFLIGILREVSNATTAIAITQNQEEMALGKVLVPQAKWHVGEPQRLLMDGSKELDVVASILPMGMRTNRPLSLTNSSGALMELSNDVGNQILVASAMNLNVSGIGLFVVTPSFFSSEQSVYHRIGDFGIGIEAAFSLPPGTFAPHTNIPTYLVVVRKKMVSRMFVAQLSKDTNTNLQIIRNFRRNREGRSFELGRFVDPSGFKSIKHLRISDEFAIAEKRFGAPAVKLENLAKVINMGRHGHSFSFQPLANAIYVPLIGNSEVLISLDDLTMKPQNYSQLVIDSSRSNAQFVAQFLNSELGKELRELTKAGFIPKLNKQTLKELRVFVPDLATQRNVLALEDKIAAEQTTIMALQNELTGLRREVWTNPRSADDVEQRLGALKKQLSGGIKQHTSETLSQWFETLPFPLASILRAWQTTQSNDFKTKYEHLLHFFEATAEFLSVILLSAFSSNDAVFATHRQKLAKTMQKQHLSYERATFGTWKIVVDYLGKQTRKLLCENGKKTDDAKNDLALCGDMFADPSLSLPIAVSRKELAGILATTNQRRNDWKGHGTVVGQEEANLRNQQLLVELEKLREVIADTWDKTQLIRVLSCEPRTAQIRNEVAILMGSHPEFVKESRQTSMLLYVEHLYVSRKNSGKALKLLPLVQVGPSPQSAKNACYFFNRLERDGARFVSYHFTDKPELKGQFEEAADAIKLLSNINMGL